MNWKLPSSSIQKAESDTLDQKSLNQKLLFYSQNLHPRVSVVLMSENVMKPESTLRKN
jgi:hypothetical protein